MHMNGRRLGRTGRRACQHGQMAIFMVLILCLFLLAALGFAVDYTNIWFQRQQAQTAADAACQAGIRSFKKLGKVMT